MSLKEKFCELIENYAEQYANAHATNNFSIPLGTVVRHDIPNILTEHISIKNYAEKYTVKGNTGSGRTASVPWIAVFNTAITTEAKKGVYIVYLINKDTGMLYLTLIKAAGARNPNKEQLANIAKIAQSIAQKLGIVPIAIASGNESYNKGVIYAKEYTLASLLDDEVLFADLEEFIALYQRYYTEIFMANDAIAADEGKSHLFTDEESTNDEEPAASEERIMPASASEALAKIKEYIAGCGFTYPAGLIENFYLSLKAKPFVILAGTSGTGKTRLVRLFAEAIGARYELVAVRPDWSDGSDLLGHSDLNGNFIPGPVRVAIDYAWGHPQQPVLLCLDEMNLARVEYYFSDFLSVIETRERHADGSITTAPLAIEQPYALGIPDNLYIIGTVNMDETTFAFSKKVLDRANTIEFNHVDLMPIFSTADTDMEPQRLANSFLRSEYLLLNRDCAAESEYVTKICSELAEINEVLATVNAHIGYRVRDEVVFYLLYNKAAELLPQNVAMDNAIMQKILPRLQGNSLGVCNMLAKLFELWQPLTDSAGYASELTSEHMKISAECRYPRSSAKLIAMVKRFEEDGFTSYWE